MRKKAVRTLSKAVPSAGGGPGGEWLAQPGSGPLTSLALHRQADADTFIYEVHNSPEVILAELSRGQGWGPWEGGRRGLAQSEPPWQPSFLPQTPQVSPSRRPPGVMALRSPGQVFLLAVMDTSSSTRSARAPSRPLGRRSTSTRWLSVPPEGRDSQQAGVSARPLSEATDSHPPPGSPDTSE